MKIPVDAILVLLGVSALILEFMYFAQFFGNQWWILVFFTPSLALSSTLYAIFSGKKRKTALFLIFVLAFLSQVIYFLYSKGFSYIPSRDASYHYQIIDDIIKQHYVPFGGGKELALEYSYYPGMHIVLATLSMTTGLGSVTIAKISPLLYIVAPFGVYLLSRKIFCSESIAQLSAVIYVFSPFLYSIPASRAFGLTFFVLTLFALFSAERIGRGKNLRYAVLTIIFFFGLLSGHFLTLCVFIIFLLFVSLASKLPPKLTRKRLGGFQSDTTVLLLSLGLSWIGYLAWPLLSGQSPTIISLLRAEPAAISLSGAFSGYATFEQVFMAFSFFSILLLGLVGFFLYLRGRYDSRIVSVSVFLSLLFLSFYFLRNLNETFDYLSQRIWGFLFVVWAPLAAYAFSRLRSSRFKFGKLKTISVALIVVLLFSYAFSFFDSLPKQYYDFNIEAETGLVTAMRGYGEKAFASVKWYILYADLRYPAIGDSPIRDLGGQFKESASNIRLDYDVYYNQSRLDVNDAKYVFIDNLLLIYDQSPRWKEYVPTANASYLNYLSSSRLSWNRVYDNSLVCIVQISD